MSKVPLSLHDKLDVAELGLVEVLSEMRVNTDVAVVLIFQLRRRVYLDCEKVFKVELPAGPAKNVEFGIDQGHTVPCPSLDLVGQDVHCPAIFFRIEALQVAVARDLGSAPTEEVDLVLEGSHAHSSPGAGRILVLDLEPSIGDGVVLVEIVQAANAVPAAEDIELVFDDA